MSYENTVCPCGGKKPTDTMFCSDCEAYLADRPEKRVYLDKDVDVDIRRHAAGILLTLAKGRRRG